MMADLQTAGWVQLEVIGLKYTKYLVTHKLYLQRNKTDKKICSLTV